MKLRPLGNFVGNGVLRGNLGAFDDSGEPLWESYGNWSLESFREKASKSLAEATGVSEDKARAGIAQALREARKAADTTLNEGQEELERVMIARLPGLVDIVDLAAKGQTEQPAFLFVNPKGLQVAEEWESGGKSYIPPQGDHLLPIRPLPRYGEVEKYFHADNGLSLFSDLRQWHKTASNLGYEWRYSLMALWAIHTYVADKIAYSPCIVLHSRDGERGKSRQGRATASVSYRGFTTETLQEANLFRWADGYGLTIFFDVFDLWRKAEKKGVEDLILGRFDRFGSKVARVLDPGAGAFKDTRYFDVYGPTIIATNEQPHDLLLSRSIVIVPPEASGRYPNLTPEDALPFRERLCAFRARHLLIDLPQVGKPSIGRLGDILQPLAQVATLLGPQVEEGFKLIVKELEAERKERVAEAPEARLLEVICRCIEEGELREDKGIAVIPIANLVSFFNEGLPEKRHVTPEQMGRRLAALGFRARRMSDETRTRARVIDANLLSLCRKYAVQISEKMRLQLTGHTGLLSSPDTAPDMDGFLDSKGEPSEASDAGGSPPDMASSNLLSTPTVQFQTETGLDSMASKDSKLTPHKPHPSAPCGTCHENVWWWRPTCEKWGAGEWLCGRCHPQPGPGSGE